MPADIGAVPGETVLEGGSAFGGCNTDEDRSDGFAVVFLGAGDACGGDPNVRAQRRPDTRGHGRGDVAVHRADGVQQLGRNTQDVDFDGVWYATTPPCSIPEAPAVSARTAVTIPAVSDSAAATVRPVSKAFLTACSARW